MLSLTGIKGQKQELKMSMIKEIKAVPDTLLVMKNGNCMMVQETVEEVVAKNIANPLTLANRIMGVLA